MSHHEGRHSAARVLVALALITAVVFFGTAQAATTGRSTAVLQGQLEPICWHDQLSQWYCPDTSASSRWLSAQNAAMSVRLTVTGANGRSRTIRLPRGTDAIFLSKSSVENFLLRYYDATKAADKAAGVRKYVGAHSAAP